jgi:flagellar biosynthesis/type III secretory pathway protein FliH
MEEFGMGALDLIRAEGVAEGRAEGVAEGRAEGVAEGRAEGVAEGRAEGEAKGGAKMLIEVLRARGVSLGASAEQRILATGDLATLERWMHRALAARTIDEVLD